MHSISHYRSSDKSYVTIQHLIDFFNEVSFCFFFAIAVFIEKDLNCLVNRY